MSKATSCRDAIKNWEAKTNQVAAEAKEVALFCQIPFIDKMDDSLNQLENCEKLSLSTNQIERIINFEVLSQKIGHQGFIIYCLRVLVLDGVEYAEVYREVV